MLGELGDSKHAHSLLFQVNTMERVTEGDLVAAPYQGDQSLYRARVETVLDDGRTLDLYYVDYGDNGDVPTAECVALRYCMVLTTFTPQLIQMTLYLEHLQVVSMYYKR